MTSLPTLTYTPPYLEGGRSVRTASLEQERRELFESVLQSLRVPQPDADRLAACGYLLRHLARTEHGG